MADRKITRSTDPNINGADWMDELADKIGMLFDNMTLVPTSIINSGNDYTMTLDPILDGDVKQGMGFYIQPNAANTNPVRLRYGTEPYYDVVKSTGDPLGSGEWSPALVYFVVFIGGQFRILSAALAGGTSAVQLAEYIYTTNDTWTKGGIDPKSWVLIEAWGGGGGGGGWATGSTNTSGGGGGRYSFALFRAADLPATVAITIGGGGAGVTNGVAGTGGTTSAGSFVVAEGGLGGNNSTGATAGGNGGGLAQITAAPGTFMGVGGKGATYNTPGATVEYGGGGGAASGASSAPGLSRYGGNGGTASGNGQVPGGGGAGRATSGGAGGNGAGGMVRIRVIGG